ncbi:MAG: pantoate--beta-alanine ligase [Ilumatobacteraceae bacterium]
MFVAADPAAMRAWSREAAARGARVALVPTMGALHDGHMALVERARLDADVVVLSLFVNPLQFERADDFDRYPRPIDDDLDICRRHGIDAVYAPTAAAMYPDGFQTHVVPGPMAALLEGEHRPGHFEGVTTVVAKLFHAVEPRTAVFGEKDAQQLAIIRRMVVDLDLGIEIVGLPTVREPDGVAMSSRNRRLTEEQRHAAVCVPRALEAVRSAATAGTSSSDDLVAVGRAVVETEPLARFEHLCIVDPSNLTPVDRLDTSLPQGSRALVVTAVWFGEVRLIDNCRL